jgi:H+/Cl- antiporter ClcA
MAVSKRALTMSPHTHMTGMAISSGIVLPMLVIGATLGRIVGQFAQPSVLSLLVSRSTKLVVV